MFNGQKNLFSDSNNPNFAPYQQNFNNVPSWQPYQNCQNQSFVQASNQMCENPLEFNLKLDFQRGPPGGVQRDLNGFQVVGNGVQGSGNGVQGIRNACQGISNSVQGISNGIQGISNGVQGIVMGNGVQGNFSGMQGGPTGGTPFNISQYQQPTHQWQPCNQYYSSSNQNGTNLYQNEMSPIMQLEQIRNQMCARPFELKFHMNHFTSTSDLLDSPFQIQQSRGRPDFQNLSGTANDGSNSANQNASQLEFIHFQDGFNMNNYYRA